MWVQEWMACVFLCVCVCVSFMCLFLSLAHWALGIGSSRPFGYKSGQENKMKIQQTHVVCFPVGGEQPLVGQSGCLHSEDVGLGLAWPWHWLLAATEKQPMTCMSTALNRAGSDQHCSVWGHKLIKERPWQQKHTRCHVYFLIQSSPWSKQKIFRIWKRQLKAHSCSFFFCFICRSAK